jgi:hypothetical protein
LPGRQKATSLAPREYTGDGTGSSRDSVDRFFPTRESLQIFDKVRDHPARLVVAAARGVRRDVARRQVPQTVISRQRLGRGDVKVRRGDESAFERVRQRVLVIRVAAPDVEIKRTGMKTGEPPGVEESARLVAQWKDVDDDPRVAEVRIEFVDRQRRRCLVAARLATEGGDVQMERLQQFDESPGNRAVADDERLLSAEDRGLGAQRQVAPLLIALVALRAATGKATSALPACAARLAR